MTEAETGTLTIQGTSRIASKPSGKGKAGQESPLQVSGGAQFC